MGSDSQMPAARLGDIDTGHHSAPPTPIITGSAYVSINGKPAARRGDKLAPHHAGQRVIMEGAATVLINGLPAARVGDAINCGGTLAIGSSNVVIGNRPKLARNSPAAAEWSEFLSELAKAGKPPAYTREIAQLAAAVAMRHRGAEGAVAVWHEHYTRSAEAVADPSDPHEAAGYQRALAEKSRLQRDHEAVAKGERWRARQQQIAQGRAQVEAMPPGPDRDRLAAATDRFAQNNVAVEKARLAEDVYDPDGGPPPGWINISDDPEALARIGLKFEHLQEPGSKFRAQVYAPDPAVFGSDMKTTVSFKGTTPSCGEDWQNNIAQGFNRDSLYYKKAVVMGEQAFQSGADIEFCGHSLGGGLASAAARASGLAAVTLNGAGLHRSTVERYGGTPKVPDPDNILAVRVDGDPLTAIQRQSVKGTLRSGGVGAIVGGLIAGPAGAAAGAGIGSALKAGAAAAMPDAAGVTHKVTGTGINPLARHGMSQVIAGIEQQKDEDQAVLAACLT